MTNKFTKLKGQKSGVLKARPYQVEIANIALNESIVAKLNTGLGKTFIAVMVIKEHLHETYRPIAEGGRRIVFIAKTVHLVYQHADFLRTQLPIPSDEIGVFHGQVSPSVWIDTWNESIWRGQLEKHRVLVITAGVFRDVLNHCKVSLRNVCLIIFDECHHADPKTRSDFTDICKHLHNFPKGRWLPDYSRGPKVLGLSASLVNNMKAGENLEDRLSELEQLMRARIVTSTHDSINMVTGLRQRQIVPFKRSGANLLPGQPYHPFAQALEQGAEKITVLTKDMKVDEYIDLETLLDANRRIRKELFLSVMELHEFSPKKMKRVLQQCLRVADDFGVYCALHACEQSEKALLTIMKMSGTCQVKDARTVRVIQTCLTALSESMEAARRCQQRQILAAPAQPSREAPNDPAWGPFMLARFPMTLKTITLFRVLRHYREKVEADGEHLSILLLVKERIATAALAKLINDVSEVVPFYAGFRASHCVSSNPNNNVATMSTGEQLNVLEGFRNNAFNILVATNVVEEGLDVRACNVVIKADELTNYRSFIQSQGRARASVSYFVLLTEDADKTRNNVQSYLNLESRINDALVNRRIENMVDGEEEEEDDPTGICASQLDKETYMPFGPDGPRITTSSAPSVLMRYIALLKTDTSYPLKILYSIAKENWGYRAQLLMPPPSPLQDVIKGPLASDKDLAKRMVRLEACKRLHREGLLDSDLLPIDFRKLIVAAKHTQLSDQTGAARREEEMNDILVGISRLTVNNTPQTGAGDDDDGEVSLMRQAQLLLTPLEDDLFTSEGPMVDPYPEVDQEDDVETRHLSTIPEEEMEEEKEEREEEGEISEQEEDDNYFTPLDSTSKTSPPIEKSSGSSDEDELTFYGGHVVDDELPVSFRKKNSTRQMNRARYYEIHRLKCLSAPYQSPIQEGRNVYLYTWKLPSPKDVATATNVDVRCFQHTDQTIGLLFSQPITESEYVCRVPLYMQFGVMRVRLCRSATWVLSAEQARLAHAAHRQLARLSCAPNKATHLDLNFHCAGDGHLDFFSTPLLQPSAAPNVRCTDPFSELKLDPENAGICALLVIVKLPNMQMDEEASRALVDWGAERDFYVSRQQPESADGQNRPSPPPHPKPGTVPLLSGVCSRYGLSLASLPPSSWAGRLVRPIDLPERDPAGYAVLGPDEQGLCGANDLSAFKSIPFPEELKGRRPVSFLDFVANKHTPIVKLVQNSRGIDPSMPVASVVRISRNLKASNVMTGLCSIQHPLRDEHRLAAFCMVHPLSTWLWIILCLTPTVLRQLYRCLSIGELSIMLRQKLDSSGGEASNVPKGKFCMPDRDSEPPTNTPGFKAYLMQIKPGRWRFARPSPVFENREEAHLDTAFPLRWNEAPPMSCEAPPLDGLMEAFTTVNSLDAVNLERLELLGDAFLKFCASLQVYATQPPTTAEGQLTLLRVAHISNANLHRTAARLGLFRYVAVDAFKHGLHYVPPYYALVDAVKAREEHDTRMFVKMYDKSVADSIEALLGVSVLTLDPVRCARLLQMLGLTINDSVPTPTPARRFTTWVPLILGPKFQSIDPGFAGDSVSAMAKRRIELEKMLAVNSRSGQVGASLPLLQDQESNFKPDIEDVLEGKRRELALLETTIGYKFRRVVILLQAITHPSSRSAHLWGCYQRLEFLGDAVLDFVVTRRIYEEHPDMDPGELTDLKIALVSNINLAVVAVRLGIHNFLDFADSNLWGSINRLTSTIIEGNYGSIWHLEHEFNERSETLSYKVIGDMLEAIIGAIFVDSGGSQDVVTSMIYHLLDAEFKSYGENVPMDPVRKMHEKFPDLKVKVSEKPVEADVTNRDRCSAGESSQQRKKVIAEVTWQGKRYVGEGYNTRTAKFKIAQQLGVDI